MSADTPLSPTETAHWARIGTLSALAVLLGYLESFLPIPIPGVKLGLANVAVLVALAEHDLTGAFFVGAVKVLATGLLFGNPVTLAYALTGTLLAFACMAPLSLLPTMRIEMVSIVGALAHETGQLLVAQQLLGTPLVWYGAPVLAVAGCATGLLCGIVARRTAPLLEGLADQTEAGHPMPGTPPAPAGGMGGAVVMLVGYLALVVLAMHATRAPALACCLCCSAALAAAAKLSPRDLAASLAPTLPLALVTLVAQVASAQQGHALASLGPVTLTHEALWATCRMAGRLVAISCASVAVVALVGRERLSAMARLSLAPLRTAGVRTTGPELALSTALDLIAQLSTSLSDGIGPRDVWKPAFWTQRLPQLVQDIYRQACGMPPATRDSR